MSKEIEDKVWGIAEPIACELGYELIDVEFLKRRDADSELIVYIDKQNGSVSIDDCERLSKALDGPMDEQDPVPGSYVLCVSSPGADRPLKNERDFKRSVGCEVDVKLYKKTNGKKDYTGILLGFDDNSLRIDTGIDTIEFQRKDIALIRLHLSF